MMHHPQLIVMLTHHDRTVANAREIFEACKHSKAQFWGFKEDGLPLPQMKELYAYMRQCGKTTFLEVVAYTEEECLQGAKMAAECGCDVLMGTLFFDSVNQYCQAQGLKYMPFVGRVTQRPSILEGSAEEMIQQAKAYLHKGVFGLNLLGYRHTGDAEAVIRQFCREVDAPVCVAGSVDNFQKVDTLLCAGAWAFTIGGAFFENKFSGTFAQQIDQVCDHLQSAALAGAR